MIDVMFPKRATTPRERDTRPIPNDYRPRQVRALDPAGVEGGGYCDDPGGALLEETAVNLHKLEDELNRNRLNEIAALVRTLTYGEMMELAQAIWKIRPEGTVDQHSLPMMLHLWSVSSTSDADASDGRVPDIKAAE